MTAVPGECGGGARMVAGPERQCLDWTRLRLKKRARTLLWAFSHALRLLFKRIMYPRVICTENNITCVSQGLVVSHLCKYCLEIKCTASLKWILIFLELISATGSFFFWRTKCYLTTASGEILPRAWSSPAGRASPRSRTQGSDGRCSSLPTWLCTSDNAHTLHVWGRR